MSLDSTTTVPEGSPSASGSNSTSLLSFPAPTVPEVPLAPPVSQPRSLLKDRLYVGNLHPTVDEYTLLQVFSKYGKISKLDFLFHKTGPMKGKPRGYAFVEFADSSDAAKALVSANDKLLRGRKIVVTYAHQAPTEDYAMGSASRSRRTMTDAGKPTTLSLLKSTGGNRSATEDKIAKMEAKLRQLGKSAPESSLHPSLPPKPANVSTSVSNTLSSKAGRSERQAHRPTTSLPSFPIPNSQSAKPSTGLRLAPSTSTGTSSVPRRGASITGIKICKPKSKNP
ncbi:hypothetical protein QCA50_014949 [Cerrena zonata]|uniref:Probable RNA-binding protein 18 n=1 Tax=Cerrena zonata TaxID=2478898 RepID=A0AAW0FMD7_9APHY